MGQRGAGPEPGRISGQIIINELIRNMDLGQLEMGYSVLLPCIFSIYLHPDDLTRLAGVQQLVREDAKRALNARVEEWNRSPSVFHRASKSRKLYRIARKDWWIEFFPDTESSVPRGDVEIHSELNEVAQPGYRGAKTSLIGREPSVTAARVASDRETARGPSEKVFAEIRYQDDSGPQTFFVTQNQVRIGRGGDDIWVDLPLYTTDEVSREHLELLRDAASGAFVVVDKSRNGTWVNGRKLTRGAEERVSDGAEIGVADALTLYFEVRR